MIIHKISNIKDVITYNIFLKQGSKEVPTQRYLDLSMISIVKEQEYERRLNQAKQLINKLSQVIKDPTFKFIIYVYDNFYVVHLFEGLGLDGGKNVLLGSVESKYYHLIPVRRRTIKNLDIVEMYIRTYNKYFIEPSHVATKLSYNERMPIKVIEESNVKYKVSRAVYITQEQLLEWANIKKTPTPRKLVNGKQFNVIRHKQKFLEALEIGQIIKKSDFYIVYWD